MVLVAICGFGDGASAACLLLRVQATAFEERSGAIRGHYSQSRHGVALVFAVAVVALTERERKLMLYPDLDPIQAMINISCLETPRASTNAQNRHTGSLRNAR